MDGHIYPLRLEPRFSRRLWGGDSLPERLGRTAPGDDAEPVGESWMVYAENVVLNGAHAGETLQDVADRLGPSLVGSRSAGRYGKQVPLLAKFIDAAQDLSVQVHPDDAYARSFEAASGHLGKSEAWYVLQAEPGASVLWGFRDDLTAEALRRAALDGSLPDRMNRVPVRPGDVVYNPAGTVHAIGAGIVLFEIQQSSDLTYRLYDYQRRDAAGRERALHLRQALEVACLEGGDRALVPPRDLPGGWRRLVDCAHFVMDARTLASSPAAASTGEESLTLLVLTEGAGALRWSGGEVDLTPAEAWVLPAALGAYALRGRGRVLRCSVSAPPDGGARP